MTTVTEQDRAAVTPAMAADYLRHIDAVGGAEWATMMFWRGIITQAEYFTAYGVTMTDEQVDGEIADLRLQTAKWLLS
jgi:hypothetical protein